MGMSVTLVSQLWKESNDVVNWANIDPVLCRYVPSLGHSELKKSKYRYALTNIRGIYGYLIIHQVQHKGDLYSIYTGFIYGSW